MRLGALVIVALTIVSANSRMSRGAEPVLPDSRLGVRTAPLLLLSRPDVRADLGLNAAQSAEADAAIRAISLKARGVKGQSGEAAIAARRAIDAEQQQWLESRLSEAQLSRLVQIDLQWEGPSALVSRPALADALGLSPEQRARLKQGVAASSRRHAQGATPSTGERLLGRLALEVLSKSQQERWQAILGRAFRPQLSAAR